MFTVKEFLEMFEDIKLAAGKVGIYRCIRAACVSDSPNGYTWISGNDLVLSSGYIWQANFTAMETMLTELHKRGAAAFAVKVGLHLPEIPQKILNKAEELGLPLLIVPSRYPWAEILKKIFQRIAEDERNEKTRLRFLEELLEGNPRDWNGIARTASAQWGCSFEKGITALLVVPDSQTSLKGAKMTEAFRASLFSLSVSHFLKQFGKAVYGSLYDKLIFLAEAEGPNLHDRLQTGADTIRLAAQTAFHTTVTVGISGTGASLADAPFLYREAWKAAEISQKLYPGNHTVFAEDLGVLPLLMDIREKPETAAFVKRYVEPLQAYDEKNDSDLFRTLGCIIRNGWNLKTAAADMFVHYNTLRYKYQKIRELLCLDEKKADQRLNVEIAWKLYMLGRA